jgi:AcrR family transcriptional regulator
MTAAARMFAARGFHGVSVDDIGAAVGITGPALYRHFRSKEALLADMLVEVSEDLLAGGRARAVGDPAAALADLVDFHIAFAVSNQPLISVQDRDFDSVPDTARRRVRVLQRGYVEVWVGVLRQAVPGLDEPTARSAAHAVFGLLNSTPRLRDRSGGLSDRDEVAALLRRMALAALRDLSPRLPPSPAPSGSGRG